MARRVAFSSACAAYGKNSAGVALTIQRHLEKPNQRHATFIVRTIHCLTRRIGRGAYVYYLTYVQPNGTKYVAEATANM